MPNDLNRLNGLVTILQKREVETIYRKRSSCQFLPDVIEYCTISKLLILYAKRKFIHNSNWNLE